MRSALYAGRVAHRRLVPRQHSFRYGVVLHYLDLEELPTLLRSRGLLREGRMGLLSFHRPDYLGDPEQPLREAVLDRVEQALGRRPGGHVGILTQIRTLGYVFNPVSFYLCHGLDGRLDSLVAEITNTPWGERHAYVLDARDAHLGDGVHEFVFTKAFHISPFCPMEQRYRWRFVKRGSELQISMANSEDGKHVFGASLEVEARPLDRRALAWSLVRFPLQPLRMHLAIYWQAAVLFFKRVPVFTHPKKLRRLSGVSTR